MVTNMFPRLGENVLPPQAGYPQGKFHGAFDPAMGRGYRIGVNRVIEAGADNLQVHNAGMLDQFFRWKVSLSVQQAPGTTPPAATAHFLTITVRGASENDQIDQVVQVPLGGAQVVYCVGRALSIIVDNPTDLDLVLNYRLDEATPGLSSWTTTQAISGSAGTELELALPNFTNTLQVYSPSTGPTWVLRGYDLTGALVYDEVLTAPRSAAIPVLPTLAYTLEPNIGAAVPANVLYQCAG